jgi:hypothetical protein
MYCSAAAEFIVTFFLRQRRMNILTFFGLRRRRLGTLSPQRQVFDDFFKNFLDFE